MFRRDIEIKKIVIATGRTDIRKGIDGLVSVTDDMDGTSSHHSSLW